MQLVNKSFFLHGYVSTFTNEGFGMPIFIDAQSEVLYFQDVDPKNIDKIIGFTPIDDGYNIKKQMILVNKIESISHFGNIKIGDYPVFMFETEEFIFFDTRAGLYYLLKGLIDNGAIVNKYIEQEIKENFYIGFNESNALKLNLEVDALIHNKSEHIFATHGSGVLHRA